MLGKTFKGMTDAMLAWQTERLQELAVDENGYVVTVRPELVVEIAYDGLQRSTRYPAGVTLRFARVLRYREDKTPRGGGHGGDPARRPPGGAPVTPAAPRRSAGLLLFRRTGDGPQVLLGHMGGPVLREEGRRGLDRPEGRVRARRTGLGGGPPRVPGGAGAAAARRRGDRRWARSGRPTAKIVTAWAIEADLDPASVEPGTFTMEWPPRSGRVQEFPELDRVAWLGLDRAREVIVTAQAAFLDRLAEHSV